MKPLCAALAAVLSMACVAPAFARDHDGDRDHDRNERGVGRGDGRGDGRGEYRGDRRGPPGHAYGYDRRARYDFGPRDYPRGAGPDNRFHRGERLAPEYRGRQYVVDDWRGHHLNAPPRGYNWVQVGGDYVLVAVATGIIASLILSR
ncbi:MAG: RcnB family protein [Pseudomonadota bacterium]